ncbi:MAG: CBS domain-containing protein, partial [Candidatus Methanomethylophilaceae archaeon]|nr:CBS domain-containing protein [Candidatus Methanomethylophilaceae archaeon]
MSRPVVGDYMVGDVKVISPNLTIEEARQKLINSVFHGYPVAENGYLLGFVTAKDILRHIDTPDAKIRSIIQEPITTSPSTTIEDVIRIMFRYGIRNLPVLDDNRKLVGIISNIDIIRRQIEKVRPAKIESVKSFLQQKHDIKFKEMTMEIPVSELRPTQKEVYGDELRGRQYEIDHDLSEYLIVIKRARGYLI